jgi:hypothetical protein
MSDLYTTEEGKYPEKKNSSENLFFGNGWKIEKINDEYFLLYLSAKQGGDEEKINISYPVFKELLNRSTMTLKEIIEKYKLKS